MRALLYVNGTARLGRKLGAAVRRELVASGIEIADWPAPEATSEWIDCVVAAGGDGTIVSVIGRAIELGVPVGIVPIGTFNDLARTLHIPLDIHAACATIAAARTRTIDVARVNGAFFVNEASIGISSRITRLQTPEVKRRFGVFAIVATAFQAFRYSRPMRAEVYYDDRIERFRTVQLTVANSHRFGGLFMVGDAAIDDGWLDLYSLDIESVAEAFSVARAIFQGKRESVPGLRTYRATRFTVTTRHRHRITADGEPAGSTPAVFDVLPKALRVFVPEESSFGGSGAVS